MKNGIRKVSQDYRETRYFCKRAKIKERRTLKRRRSKMIRAYNRSLCRELLRTCLPGSEE